MTKTLKKKFLSVNYAAFVGVSMTFKSLFFCFTIFTFAFFLTPMEAGFSNSGRMQSRNLQLCVGGTLDNQGELIGTESANLSCDTLTGKGLISAPMITIKAKIFAFTGRIHCTNQCLIITSQPFNERMFKALGGGQFTVVVDDNFDRKTSIDEVRESSLEDSFVIYQ